MGGVNLAEPNRQSPLAAVFLVIRGVRSFGIVQIVVAGGFLLSQSPSIWLVALGAAVVVLISVVIGLLSWWRYTFTVKDGELSVRKGVLSANNLTVPLDRVQTVSIEQKFLHRIVKLVQVSLDTAGASEAEFTIDAVSEDVALALQRAAADYRRDTAVARDAATGDPLVDRLGDAGPIPAPLPRPDEVVLQHPPGRIIKMALTQMPFSGLAVLAPLFAFGEDIFGWLPIDLPEVDLDVGAWLFWFVPVAILAVVLASVILNLISTLLRDWNLTLTKTDVGLRRDAGLLSRTSVASSLVRVQSIATSQTIFQKWLGLYHVTLHNIGDADVAVPGCDETQVQLVRDLALDDGDGVEVLNRYVSSQAVFKATRNTAFFMIPLAIGLYFVLGWWSLLFLLIIPITWATTRRSVRLQRWGIDADAVADHQEFLGWTRKEVLIRKTNSVQVRQSMFERKRGLATVQISLAGGLLGGGSLSIGMIPLAEAQAVRDRVLYVAETDKRAFM